MGLIADIQSDIEKGAVRLISEYRSRLVAEAHRLCENQSDVEDLVSRTLVKVINNIDSHDENCDFYAWMKSIMVNLHRDDLDRPVTRGTQPVDEETLEQCAGVDWSTDEQIVRNSDCEALRAALRDISPEYKQTVILRFYEDLSLQGNRQNPQQAGRNRRPPHSCRPPSPRGQAPRRVRQGEEAARDPSRGASRRRFALRRMAGRAP